MTSRHRIITSYFLLPLSFSFSLASCAVKNTADQPGEKMSVISPGVFDSPNEKPDWVVTLYVGSPSETLQQLPFTPTVKDNHEGTKCIYNFPSKVWPYKLEVTTNGGQISKIKSWSLSF